MEQLAWAGCFDKVRGIGRKTALINGAKFILTNLRMRTSSGVEPLFISASFSLLMNLCVTCFRLSDPAAARVHIGLIEG